MLLSACFLIFQTVVCIDVLYAEDLGEQKSDLPRPFLPKTESSVTIRKEGNPYPSWSNKSTLEEILERIAVRKAGHPEVLLPGPGSKPRKSGRLKISAASLEKALRQLLSEAHRSQPLNREGKPIEDGRDIATVNIYPKGCAETDPPVRVFIAEREHPSAKKVA